MESRQADHAAVPWQGVQQALTVFSSNVASNLQQVAQHVERHVQPWQRNVESLVQGVQQQLLGQQQQLQRQRQQRQQQQRQLFAPLAVSSITSFCCSAGFQCSLLSVFR